VSRTQARVQVVTPEFAVIYNGSRNRSFAIDATEILAPEESKLFAIPFTIILDSIEISFEVGRDGPTDQA